MQVEASRSDDMVLSNSHSKIGYRRVSSDSGDVCIFLRLPGCGKSPKDPREPTMLSKRVGELPKGLLATDR